MSGLAQRIGFHWLVQIIIECWNEAFLLLLLIVMLIGIRRDSKSELTRSVKIPFTWELIVFYGAAFLYNLFDILDIVFGGMPARLSYIVIRCGVFGYYAVGGFNEGVMNYLRNYNNTFASSTKASQKMVNKLLEKMNKSFIKLRDAEEAAG